MSTFSQRYIQGISQLLQQKKDELNKHAKKEEVVELDEIKIEDEEDKKPKPIPVVKGQRTIRPGINMTPTPYKEKIESHGTDIWNQSLNFKQVIECATSNGNWYHQMYPDFDRFVAKANMQQFQPSEGFKSYSVPKSDLKDDNLGVKSHLINKVAQAAAGLTTDKYFKEMYQDQSNYNGQWKLGLRHGTGTTECESGLSLSGKYVDDVFTGGIIQLPKHYKLTGDMKNGKLNGEGTINNKTKVQWHDNVAVTRPNMNRVFGDTLGRFLWVATIIFCWFREQREIASYMIALYYVGSMYWYLVDFPMAQNQRPGVTLTEHLKNIGQSNLFIRWNITSEDKQHGFQRMFKYNKHAQLLGVTKLPDFIKGGIVTLNIRDYVQLSSDAQCSYQYQMSQAKKDMADRLDTSNDNMTVIGESLLEYPYSRNSTWISNYSAEHLIEPWYTNSLLYFFLTLIGLSWFQRHFVEANKVRLDVFFLKYIVE